MTRHGRLDDERSPHERGHGLDEWTDGYIDACDEIFGILKDKLAIAYFPEASLRLRLDLAEAMGLSEEARRKYGLVSDSEVPASAKPKGDH